MMTEHEAEETLITKEEYQRLRHAEYQREWRKRNPGSGRESAKLWAESNKEKTRAYKAKYRAKNKDKINAADAEYRVKNKEKIRKYYDENIEAAKRRAKECYLRNRQAYIDRAKKQREEALPQKLLYTSAKYRAKRGGLPFNIDIEDIVIPEYCPALGLKLERNTGGKVHGRNSPSLDKIIPDLGYVKGNIQVISTKANTMKASAFIEELLKFAEWVQDEWGKK